MMSIGHFLGLNDTNQSEVRDKISRKRKFYMLLLFALVIFVLCHMGYWPHLLVLGGCVLSLPLTRSVWRRTPRGSFRYKNGADGFAKRAELRKYVGSRVARRGSPGARRGTLLGYTIVGPTTPRPIRIAQEDSIGMLGGTRRGKTAELVNLCVNHGEAPLVTMSARLDLYRTTRAEREKIGPVDLFNLTKSGGVESTIRWDFLAGCDRPVTATSRASAAVRQLDTGGKDQQEWLMYAAQVLRAFLLAASLARYDMYVVHSWATNPNGCMAIDEEDENADYSYNPLMIIASAAETNPDLITWMNEIRLVMTGLGENQRGSILALVANAVAFMSNPDAARMCCPRPGDRLFDVRKMIAENGTLHIVGTGRKFDPVAPLVAALLAHVYETAIEVGAEGTGRIEPALAMALDELGVGIMFPVDEYLAWGGGAGIHVWWAAQDIGQLRERWSEHKSDTIVSTTTALLIFGGIKNYEDLLKMSKLTDERRTPIPDVEDRARERTEWRPVLSPAQISRLAKFTALLLHSEIPATVISTRRWRHLPGGAPRQTAADASQPRLESMELVLVSDSEMTRTQRTNATVPDFQKRLELLKVSSEREPRKDKVA